MFSITRLTASFAVVGLATCIVPPAATASSPAPAELTQSREIETFSEDLTQRTFRYFWETTDTERCLAPDRWPTRTVSSIAATGFALTAYGVGAERGYVTREEAARRTRDCLAFYRNAPQGPEPSGTAGFKGFFYHFLKYEDGTRHGKTELSTVDTSLFLAGALFAQSYFDRDDSVEREIRDLAEDIYRRVDWNFVKRDLTGTQAKNLADSHAIAMGWYPESGFTTHDWVGYDEAMIVYVLALGSPTHPVGRDSWDQGWMAGLEKDWGTFYGQEFIQFEPMFGHQYSHVWVDFRGIRDAFMAAKGIDYFENSRRATLSQRAYGADNPNKWTGYSGDIWGWSASDGPGHIKGKAVNGMKRRFLGYAARGVSAIRVVDDGTIVPTAAGGSVPFAPEIAIPALMHMKAKHGDKLYTRYGFKDAFNPSFTFVRTGSHYGTVDRKTGWIATDHLGIDQGPILAMMENHRTGLVWKVMRKNPHIIRGLKRIGFTGGWLDEVAAPGTPDLEP